MKSIVSICLLMLFAVKAISQEKHFIFIQSDDKLVFNVNLNGKYYSSNASGYVIIPKLADGEYDVTIGFAENTFPAQAFKCIINKKDVGFGLKNFGEKGWGLFNLQSLDVTMAGGTAAPVIAPQAQGKTEDEPISFNRKSDTPAVNSAANETLQPTEKTDTAVAINTQSLVTKLDEKKSNEGVKMSFSDPNGSGTDTVEVSIPDAELVKDTLVKNEALIKQQASDSAIAAKIALLNSRKDDVKVVEIDMDQKPADSATTIKQQPVSGNIKAVQDTIAVAATLSANDKQADNNNPVAEEKPAVAEKPVAADPALTVETPLDAANNSAEVVATAPVKPAPDKTAVGFCNSLATEEDYIRLRRKMALENTDEKMIREAKKIYKDKCFTTHQVKGLSTLFLSDEGRYRFFTASYSFVSDPAAYGALQSEFIDPFYINRFKSIVQ